MPGLQDKYIIYGKRGRRRTPYRYLGVREATWYDAHRLADLFEISIVDMVEILVKESMKANGLESLTEMQAREMRARGQVQGWPSSRTDDEEHGQ